MKKRSKKQKHSLQRYIVLLIVLLAGILFQNNELIENLINPGEALSVHFIDVGQGDCTLIKSNAGTVLIDAGENEFGADVVSYLKTMGVRTIDYVIATHPHSDHIGGLPQVIREFSIGKIVMPDAVNTTATFDRLLTAIEEKNLPTVIPTPGEKFFLGDAEFLFIAPNASDYDNLNNYSIGIKMSYGQTSFLFTGDAESLSESQIISAGFNIKADVFAAGHHGSRTSNTEKFINSVNPQYCVISCGFNNDYGHPHKEVMNRLEARGINILRTDTQGTIVIESDGSSLTVHTS